MAIEEEDAAVVDPELEQGAEGAEKTADELAAEAEAKRIADEQAELAAAAEVTITIGGESPPEEEHEAAPEWVRELRRERAELVKRNRELEEQVRARAETTRGAVDPGAKPKLEDFAYDADKFAESLEAWYAKRAEADAAKRRAEAAEADAKTAWQAKLDAYGKAKDALRAKVKGFDDAEETVKEALNVTQQGVILSGADNPAMLIVALGHNPKRLRELAAITDPVKFAWACSDLERQLKVAPKRTPPPPEPVVHGSAPRHGALDSTLERLRAEAEKTGDYTKVTQYKRSKKAA